MRRHLSMLAAVVSLLIALTSCRSAAPSADYQALARAGIRLGVDIDYDDDRLLYVTAAGWVGVPYRYGGESKRGVDCSGFVRAICCTVYGKGQIEVQNNCRLEGMGAADVLDCKVYTYGSGTIGAEFEKGSENIQAGQF